MILLSRDEILVLLLAALSGPKVDGPKSPKLRVILKPDWSPSTFALELRRDLKLIDSTITEADMIPDIEKTWLRNEKCFVVYGKSFQFFKKWEGDQTEAEILFNGDPDEKLHALFDTNSETYVTVDGGIDNMYEIIFNEPILMHFVTLGTVFDTRKYANICFELFDANSEDSTNSEEPEFEICTGARPEYEFITLMVPQIMTKSIRIHFKNKLVYKISSLAIYHRGNYNQVL